MLKCRLWALVSHGEYADGTDGSTDVRQRQHRTTNRQWTYPLHGSAAAEKQYAQT